METNKFEETEAKVKIQRIAILPFIFLFIFSFISASFSIGYESESLGTFRQDSQIELTQTCNVCTYCNVSRIVYPNSSIMLSNLVMTRDGTFYNYSLNSSYSLEIGNYRYYFYCGNSTDSATGWIDFDVTTSGRNGSNNMVFNVIIILITYAVTLIGFFGRNMPISGLGGGAMIALGVYMVREGIIIYRDWISNYFSYLTIAIGAVIAIFAAVEFIEETFK